MRARSTPSSLRSESLRAGRERAELRQYLKIGGELLAFNVDEDFCERFGRCRLAQNRSRLETYMGKGETASFLDCHAGCLLGTVARDRRAPSPVGAGRARQRSIHEPEKGPLLGIERR